MAASGNGIAVPQTDPSKYAEYEAKWSKLPLPENEGQWFARAEILSNDAVIRDQENKSPRAEVTS